MSTFPLASQFHHSFILTLRIVVYHEETKREQKRIQIYECRCNERLNAKAEGSTRLAYFSPPALAFFVFFFFLPKVGQGRRRHEIVGE